MRFTYFARQVKKNLHSIFKRLEIQFCSGRTPFTYFDFSTREREEGGEGGVGRVESVGWWGGDVCGWDSPRDTLPPTEKILTCQTVFLVSRCRGFWSEINNSQKLRRGAQWLEYGHAFRACVCVFKTRACFQQRSVKFEIIFLEQLSFCFFLG